MRRPQRLHQARRVGKRRRVGLVQDELEAEVLQHMRSTRREEQAPQRDDADGVAPDFFDQQMEHRATANPERRFLGQELGRHITAALDGLSPRERMVFELKHYEGLKLRVIGDMLGTSEETVKNSLFRATRKLRASLDGMR